MRARTFTLRMLALALIALVAVACGADDTAEGTATDAGAADDTTAPTSQPDDITDDTAADDDADDDAGDGAEDTSVDSAADEPTADEPPADETGTDDDKSADPATDDPADDAAGQAGDDLATDPGADDGATGASTVTVRLEEVQGFFIEGFEVGLRFEQVDGTVLSTWRWNDVVERFGDGTAVAAYETVLEESVPAGQITVLATVNLGIGPPPEVPDLDGPMDCRVTIEVPTGGRVDVEVDFSGTKDCIGQIS